LEYKQIISKPNRYYNKQLKIDNKYHFKMSLLNELKFSRLKCCHNDNMLWVVSSKTDKKLFPFYIFIVKDRTLQMLLKLIIELYLETLSDTTSFGINQVEVLINQ